MAEFRDFIPEGDNVGAITKNGYADFVPEPEATSVVKTEVTPKTDEKKTIKTAPKAKKKTN